MLYRNDYNLSDRTVKVPVTQQDLHEHTPASQYDHNFRGGRILEMRTTDICLRPFTPSDHAQQLSDLFTQYPEVNRFRPFSTRTLSEVLHYVEDLRSNPDYCLFAVLLDDSSPSEECQPKYDTMAGIIGLDELDLKTSSIGIGPAVIFPPFQRSSVAAHAVALLQFYVFDVLGITRFYVTTQAINVAATRLGQKMSFKKELQTPGSIGHNHGIVLKSQLTSHQDPRALLKFSDELAACMMSGDWDSLGKYFTMSIGCRVIEGPLRYENSQRFRKQTLGSVPSMLESHLCTTPGNYDHNFCGTVGVLATDSVRLEPLVPSLHARQLFELISEEQRSRARINFSESIKGNNGIDRGLEGYLAYLEEMRIEPANCAWVVLQRSTTSSKFVLQGFVVLQGDIRSFGPASETSWSIGPLVVAMEYMRKDLIRDTIALLQEFAFASNRPRLCEASAMGKFKVPRPGLGCTRLTIMTPPGNLLVDQAKATGFVEEGVTRHCLPQASAKDRTTSDGWKGKSHDPRPVFAVFEVWVGSITWQDWERKQKVVTRKLLGA